MITVASKSKSRLRLTESSKRALVFAPPAAAVVADEIERAGHGAVAQRAHGSNYVLTIGKCYVAEWVA